MNIQIGLSGKTPVEIDLDVLIRTRMLIQANSGGGKSFALRKILEEAFGKIQLIVIDPAGEFASLREKFDFVLIGEHGEAQVDVRSAPLLATRLLELKASAIIDLYSLKPALRHEWLKLFLESVMNSPKSLWHPVLFVIDEAHKFMPERGEGESAAKESMLSLCSDGRKYGFCPILATQRLAKLDKSGAAELLNVMIGPTFIDIDLERAHRALGIVRSEWKEFDEQMKTVEPGNFWVLGRAISNRRILVKVGKVRTTHPKAGHVEGVLEPPPMPDKIRHLLPKLADLPAEAEKKIRTETELHAEISRLKRELTQRLMIERVPEVKIERVEVPIFSSEEKAELWDALNEANGSLDHIKALFEKIGAMAANVGRNTTAPRMMAYPQPVLIQAPEHKSSSNDDLTGPEKRILNSLGWFLSIGTECPSKVAVAFIAGYRPGGGAFNNPLAKLKRKGLVEPRGADLCLTREGGAMAEIPISPASPGAMQERVMEILSGPEKRILSPLLECYPDMLSKDELASRAGYSIGGAFNNPLSRMKTLGLITYPTRNSAKASPFLFLE